MQLCVVLQHSILCIVKLLLLDFENKAKKVHIFDLGTYSRVSNKQ